MDKLSNYFFLFLKTCVIVALILIFIASLVVLKLTNFSTLQAKLAILLILGLVIAFFVYKSELKAKHKVLSILLVSFVIRLIWIITVKTVPVSDFKTIYDSAQGFLNGNVGPLRGYGYLARFPHLVPMMVYMMGMIKAFGSYHIVAMKCVSLILSVLCVYLVYILSSYYVKKENTRLVAMTIAAVYPSFISYSSTFCTETIGVPLFLLSMILFHKSDGAVKHKWLWFLVCGMALYCSNLFRGVGIVFMLAFCIYIIFFSSGKKFTSILSLIGGYFLTAVLVSSILLSTQVIENPLWEAKEPSYATLMLKGSNFESHGAWNSEDANFVDRHLKDDDLSKKCFEVIKTRLSERSFGEIVVLYGGKFLSQWSVGDCSGTYWATFNTDIPFSYPLPKPFQLIYVAVVFLSLFVYKSGKENKSLALIFLLLCGLGTAFTILETQGRYSYVVNWAFIILAACGFENLLCDSKCTKKVKDLYKKYKQQSNYIIFGVVTTAVNVLAYYLLFNMAHIGNIPSTIIAWFASVLVAYVTNKLWVFESKSAKPAVLFKEISAFFACRLLTGVLDVGIMWLGVDILSLNSTLIKILSNVIVIILNYILSKLYIFKGGK